MWDHFLPLLFPKDSESLKILDIRLREVGAKRPLNGTSKVNIQTDTQTDRHTDRQTHRQTHTQTDRHTDRHTHIWTNRLIEIIGPEGRCFEEKKKSLPLTIASLFFFRKNKGKDRSILNISRLSNYKLCFCSDVSDVDRVLGLCKEWL